MPADHDPLEQLAAATRRALDGNLVCLASELVVDAVVPPSQLRGDVARRFATARTRRRQFSDRRHGVPPV